MIPSTPVAPRDDGLPTVSVVVPARDEARVIGACLDALHAGSDIADEIVVVDNGSSDDTARIAAAYDRVRVIPEPRRGVTYARNTGFTSSSCDVIARIDADSLVAPDWTARIRRAFAESNVDGIGGGAAIAELSPRGRFWFGWWYRGFRAWHQRSIGVAPMLYGFNSAIRATAWHNARALLATGDDTVSEDVDLTIALLRSGHVLRFDPGLRVKAHLFRTIDGDKLSRYYRTDSLTLARHRYGNRKRWAAADA